MGSYLLKAKVIFGSNIGEKMFNPRLTLIPSDPRILFQSQHKQFPIVVSLAMTINKSQGYALKKYENVSFKASYFT